MITADQLLCHAIGDYILQSHWMATEKTRNNIAALVHVTTYGLPFLFLRPSWTAYAVIVGTHFVIDRWRLARYIVWAKNFIAPANEFIWKPDNSQVGGSWELKSGYRSWPYCSKTDYQSDVPDWLAVWLLIIADNIMHILINGLALKYL